MNDEKTKVAISPAEAHRLMLQRARRMPATQVPLSAALGLALAENVTPRDDQPPFDNSAMDGYAVRAADTTGAAAERPALLEIVEVIPAGRTPTREVGVGQCAKIMTGAPLPIGADAVVRVEDTANEGGRARVYAAVESRQNVRERGEDLRRGRVALAAGQRLTPARIGLCAAAGYAEIAVHRVPRVGILVTGEELVEPGEELPPGKIRNSNAHALIAQTQEAGGEPRYYGVAPDDRAAIAALLRRALNECDLVLSSGGVSMGDFDVVEDALTDAGGEIFFRQVAQRPGAPLVGGAAGEALFFGLPGNPVSVMVCFEVHVRPVIRFMRGHRRIERSTVVGTFGAPFRKAVGLTTWARVIARREGEKFTLTLSASQGSGVLRSMAVGNGLAELPAGLAVAGPDDPITVHLFDDVE